MGLEQDSSSKQISESQDSPGSSKRQSLHWRHQIIFNRQKIFNASEREREREKERERERERLRSSLILAILE